jgi:uncharacterized membrane protein
MMNWNNGNGFGGGDDYGSGGFGGIHNGWAGGLMMLLMAIAFGLFIWLVLRLVAGPRHRSGHGRDGGCQNCQGKRAHDGDGSHGGHHRGPGFGPSPREVLDMRLAKGEVSAQEYREAKEALGLVDAPTK